MVRQLVIAMAICPGMAMADPVADIAAAADAAFAGMPRLERLEQIAGECGAGDRVDDRVAYCTTQNVVLVADAAVAAPEAAYLVAHAYGHAVQVRHGVADVALAQIRSRPAEEAMLRGLVERQVDCIAGFLWTRADLPPARLVEWFSEDPLNRAHWGRNPLRVGPVVSVRLASRDEWFQRGQTGDLAICAPGEFSADLLVEALR